MNATSSSYSRDKLMIGILKFNEALCVWHTLDMPHIFLVKNKNKGSLIRLYTCIHIYMRVLAMTKKKRYKGNMVKQRINK